MANLDELSYLGGARPKTVSAETHNRDRKTSDKNSPKKSKKSTNVLQQCGLNPCKSRIDDIYARPINRDIWNRQSDNKVSSNPSQCGCGTSLHIATSFDRNSLSYNLPSAGSNCETSTTDLVCMPHDTFRIWGSNGSDVTVNSVKSKGESVLNSSPCGATVNSSRGESGLNQPCVYSRLGELQSPNSPKRDHFSTNKQSFYSNSSKGDNLVSDSTSFYSNSPNSFSKRDNSLLTLNLENRSVSEISSKTNTVDCFENKNLSCKSFCEHLCSNIGIGSDGVSENRQLYPHPTNCDTNSKTPKTKTDNLCKSRSEQNLNKLEKTVSSHLSEQNFNNLEETVQSHLSNLNQRSSRHAEDHVLVNQNCSGTLNTMQPTNHVSVSSPSMLCSTDNPQAFVKWRTAGLALRELLLKKSNKTKKSTKRKPSDHNKTDHTSCWLQRLQDFDEYEDELFTCCNCDETEEGTLTKTGSSSSLASFDSENPTISEGFPITNTSDLMIPDQKSHFCGGNINLLQNEASRFDTDCDVDESDKTTNNSLTKSNSELLQNGTSRYDCDFDEMNKTTNNFLTKLSSELLQNGTSNINKTTKLNSELDKTTNSSYTKLNSELDKTTNSSLTKLNSELDKTAKSSLTKLNSDLCKIDKGHNPCCEACRDTAEDSMYNISTDDDNHVNNPLSNSLRRSLSWNKQPQIDTKSNNIEMAVLPSCFSSTICDNSLCNNSLVPTTSIQCLNSTPSMFMSNPVWSTNTQTRLSPLQTNPMSDISNPHYRSETKTNQDNIDFTKILNENPTNFLNVAQKNSENNSNVNDKNCNYFSNPCYGQLCENSEISLYNQGSVNFTKLLSENPQNDEHLENISAINDKSSTYFSDVLKDSTNFFSSDILKFENWTNVNESEAQCFDVSNNSIAEECEGTDKLVVNLNDSWPKYQESTKICDPFSENLLHFLNISQNNSLSSSNVDKNLNKSVIDSLLHKQRENRTPLKLNQAIDIENSSNHMTRLTNSSPMKPSDTSYLEIKCSCPSYVTSLSQPLLGSLTSSDWSNCSTHFEPSRLNLSASCDTCLNLKNIVPQKCSVCNIYHQSETIIDTSASSLPSDSHLTKPQNRRADWKHGNNLCESDSVTDFSSIGREEREETSGEIYFSEGTDSSDLPSKFLRLNPTKSNDDYCVKSAIREKKKKVLHSRKCLRRSGSTSSDLDETDDKVMEIVEPTPYRNNFLLSDILHPSTPLARFLKSHIPNNESCPSMPWENIEDGLSVESCADGDSNNSASGKQDGSLLQNGDCLFSSFDVDVLSETNSRNLESLKQKDDGKVNQGRPSTTLRKLLNMEIQTELNGENSQYSPETWVRLVDQISLPFDCTEEDDAANEMGNDNVLVDSTDKNDYEDLCLPRYDSSASCDADDEFECDCEHCQFLKNVGNTDNLGTTTTNNSALDVTTTPNYIWSDLWEDDTSLDLDLSDLRPVEPFLNSLHDIPQHLIDLMFQNVIMQMLAVHPELMGDQAPPPVPQDMIDSLPVVITTQLHLDEELSCPICLCSCQLEENLTRLSCQHLFHPLCIQAWLAKSGTCPVCRCTING